MEAKSRALCGSLEAKIMPGLEDPAVQAWKQLFVTYAKIQRRLEHGLAPHGLVLSQFEMLARTAIRPGIIQQELAEALLLTKGNIGAMLDRLEESGLIERRPDAADKRVNRLYLTESASDLISRIFDLNRSVLHEIMAPLSEHQQRQLRSLLQLVEPEG